MKAKEKLELKQAIREVMQEFFAKPVGCVHEWQLFGQYGTTAQPQTICKKCGAYLTSTTSATSSPNLDSSITVKKDVHSTPTIVN